MKQTLNKSKRKKKRRSKVTQCNLPNVSVSTPRIEKRKQRLKRRRSKEKKARRSVLQCSDYIFNTPPKLKKQFSSIKRVIQNNGPEPVKSSPSCSRYWKINRRVVSGQFKNDVGWSDICTKNFIKSRTIKMDNSANKAFPANIHITLDQMLSMRKKRFRNKYQQLTQKKVESTLPFANQKTVELSCQGSNQNNNNIPPVNVELNPQFVNQESMELSSQNGKRNNNGDVVPVDKTDPHMNNDVICTDANTINVEQRNMYPTNLDYISFDGSLMDSLLEVPITINLEQELGNKFANHSDVITSASKCKKPDNMKVVNVATEEPIVIHDDEYKESKETNVIDDDSVIIISDLNKETHDDPISNNEEVHELQRNNSIITVFSDTIDDINDQDVICVTENSSNVPANNKELNEEASVIVVDDDDEDNENDASKNRKSLVQTKGMNLRSSSVNLRQSSVNSRKKNISLKRLINNSIKARKSQTKKQVQNRASLFRRASAIMNELASCAGGNCINAPNRRRTRRSKNLSCACKNTETVVTPNLPIIIEAPKTVAPKHLPIISGEPKTVAPKQSSVNNDKLKSCGSPAQNRKPDSAVSNIYNTRSVVRRGLREIILDGSNIALGHSNGRYFSVKGLQIAINYFIKRGHKVTAFVPQYRQKYGQCTDPDLLKRLAEKRHVIYTPSRDVDRKRITPYDDRYIIQYATACEGVVVSNDHFRDLLHEKREWRETIEKRILMYTWVDDVLMFPDDPLGRRGPNLTRFLKFP